MCSHSENTSVFILLQSWYFLLSPEFIFYKWVLLLLLWLRCASRLSGTSLSLQDMELNTASCAHSPSGWLKAAAKPDKAEWSPSCASSRSVWVGFPNTAHPGTDLQLQCPCPDAPCQHLISQNEVDFPSVLDHVSPLLPGTNFPQAPMMCLLPSCTARVIFIVMMVWLSPNPHEASEPQDSFTWFTFTWFTFTWLHCITISAYSFHFSTAK